MKKTTRAFPNSLDCLFALESSGKNARYLRSESHTKAGKPQVVWVPEGTSRVTHPPPPPPPQYCVCSVFAFFFTDSGARALVTKTLPFGETMHTSGWVQAMPTKLKHVPSIDCWFCMGVSQGIGWRGGVILTLVHIYHTQALHLLLCKKRSLFCLQTKCNMASQ